ncbi:retrovirus-related Pol polyprotein from transposon 412 [Trichonephila clavipes]|nr:retrovirus-related Pol polyprotein from transposon 412 [Trichonephila clavipes]
MCIDHRKLNQKLVKDKFPLPIIEDVLDTLQEAKVYSTLDLRNGFFHVDVDEHCRKYTSFIVPDGQFEFNKVPFGLSTSPGVFQRYVSSIFRDLTRKGIVISYLDDLVIPAKNEQPNLAPLQVWKKTELHTDACKQGYGAILLQEAEDGKLHPVYYMSKKQIQQKKRQPFKIVTDCSAFQKTMQKKELITRIARWALQLEEFDYEIEHRAGSRMKHVDALSRYPVMMVCNDTLTSKLKNAQEEDDNIQTLKSLLEKQESEEFFERNGILYKYLNGRELIVTPKAMQAELIKLIHENGHFSVGKTEEIVKQEFFIPNLSNVVKKVIVNCIPCILANKKTGVRNYCLHLATGRTRDDIEKRIWQRRRRKSSEREERG